MSKKIARKDMLINQKGFIDSCNIIRKAINKYKDQPTPTRLIKLVNKVDNKCIKHKCSRTTLLECSGTHKNYVSNQYLKFEMYDFVNSVVNTTLYDRIYYARLYLDGDLSMRAIAIEADVHPTTIGKWVHDFNTYGYDMLTRAIAFNRG